MDMDKLYNNVALVVLSGGQDSTTALYFAKQHHEVVRTITFDYGQRHDIELMSARTISKMAGAASHTLVNVRGVLQGTSPLVDKSISVAHYAGPDALPGGLEATFVPMRNMLFAVIAANYAMKYRAKFIYMGVCEEDYGGYPDCREEFVRSCETAVNLSLGITGVDDKMRIRTPLMHLTKMDSVLLAKDLPGCMEALAHSHTDYDGCFPPCPHNHASILRAKGFAEAGVNDPLIVRAVVLGFLPQDYPLTGLVHGTKYDVPGRITKIDLWSRWHVE